MDSSVKLKQFYATGNFLKNLDSRQESQAYFKSRASLFINFCSNDSKYYYNYSSEDNKHADIVLIA